jgi:hypothetical protein
MRFGQYRGWELSAVPADYLRWCLANLTRLSWSLRVALEDELARRRRPDPSRPPPTPPPPPPPVPRVAVADLERLVDRWYRQLVMRWHPDRSGSHEAGMQAVNDAQELLGEMLEELL